MHFPDTFGLFTTGTLNQCDEPERVPERLNSSNSFYIPVQDSQLNSNINATADHLVHSAQKRHLVIGADYFHHKRKLITTDTGVCASDQRNPDPPAGGSSDVPIHVIRPVESNVNNYPLNLGSRNSTNTFIPDAASIPVSQHNSASRMFPSYHISPNNPVSPSNAQMNMFYSLDEHFNIAVSNVGMNEMSGSSDARIPQFTHLSNTTNERNNILNRSQNNFSSFPASSGQQQQSFVMTVNAVPSTSTLIPSTAAQFYSHFIPTYPSNLQSSDQASQRLQPSIFSIPNSAAAAVLHTPITVTSTGMFGMSTAQQQSFYPHTNLTTTPWTSLLQPSDPRTLMILSATSLPQSGSIGVPSNQATSNVLVNATPSSEWNGNFPLFRSHLPPTSLPISTASISNQSSGIGITPLYLQHNTSSTNPLHMEVAPSHPVILMNAQFPATSSGGLTARTQGDDIEGLLRAIVEGVETQHGLNNRGNAPASFQQTNQHMSQHQRTLQQTNNSMNSAVHGNMPSTLPSLTVSHQSQYKQTPSGSHGNSLSTSLVLPTSATSLSPAPGSIRGTGEIRGVQSIQQSLNSTIQPRSVSTEDTSQPPSHDSYPSTFQNVSSSFTSINNRSSSSALSSPAILGTSSITSSATNSLNHMIAQLQQHRHDPDTARLLLNSFNSTLLVSNEDIVSTLHIADLINTMRDILLSEFHEEEAKTMCMNILSHLMDSSIRISDQIVSLVPHMIALVQHCYLGDMFERVINCVEYVTRRHGKVVLLNEDVINKLLPVYDFLTSTQLRTALNLVRNCVIHLSPLELVQYYDTRLHKCNRFLIGHALKISDRECVEITCNILLRQVSLLTLPSQQLQEFLASSCLNLAGSSMGHGALTTTAILLRNIVSQECLTNLLALLINPSSPLRSFEVVFRLLATLCENCYTIALDLMQLGIATSISIVLMGNVVSSASSKHSNATTSYGHAHNLSTRKHEEVIEAMRLICNLLPPLPSRVAEQPMFLYHVNYSQHASTPPSVSVRQSIVITNVSDIGHNVAAYEQFHNAFRQTESYIKGNEDESDDQSMKNSIITSVYTLHPLLSDVFRESGHNDVKHKCIDAQLRLMCHLPTNMLAALHRHKPLASSIVNMLAESNAHILVGALHLCRVLLFKLPFQMAVPFKKEGILYKLEKLCNGNHHIFKNRSSRHLVSGDRLLRINRFASPNRSNDGDSHHASHSTTSEVLHNSRFPISSTQPTTPTSSSGVTHSFLQRSTRLWQRLRRRPTSNRTTPSQSRPGSSRGFHSTSNATSSVDSLSHSHYGNVDPDDLISPATSTNIGTFMSHSYHASSPIPATSTANPMDPHHVLPRMTLSHMEQSGRHSNLPHSPTSHHPHHGVIRHAWSQLRHHFSTSNQRANRSNVSNLPDESSHDTSAGHVRQRNLKGISDPSALLSPQHQQLIASLQSERDQDRAGVSGSSLSTGDISPLPPPEGFQDIGNEGFISAEEFIRRIRSGQIANSLSSKNGPEETENIQEIRKWVLQQARLVKSRIEDVLVQLKCTSDVQSLGTLDNLLVSPTSDPFKPNSFSPRELLSDLQSLSTELRNSIAHHIALCHAAATSLQPSTNSHNSTYLYLPNSSSSSNSVRRPLDKIAEESHTTLIFQRLLITLAGVLTNCHDEITPFEFEHSGLVEALLTYLTLDKGDRDARLRVFFRIFLHRESVPMNGSSSSMVINNPQKLRLSYSKGRATNSSSVPSVGKFFTDVEEVAVSIQFPQFCSHSENGQCLSGIPSHQSASSSLPTSSPPVRVSSKPPLSALVLCLLACLHHQEQFHTRNTPKYASSLSSDHANSNTSHGSKSVQMRENMDTKGVPSGLFRKMTHSFNASRKSEEEIREEIQAEEHQEDLEEDDNEDDDLLFFQDAFHISPGVAETTPRESSPSLSYDSGSYFSEFSPLSEPPLLSQQYQPYQQQYVIHLISNLSSRITSQTIGVPDSLLLVVDRSHTLQDLCRVLSFIRKCYLSDRRFLWSSFCDTLPIPMNTSESRFSSCQLLSPTIQNVGNISIHGDPLSQNEQSLTPKGVGFFCEESNDSDATITSVLSMEVSSPLDATIGISTHESTFSGNATSSHLDRGVVSGAISQHTRNTYDESYNMASSESRRLASTSIISSSVLYIGRVLQHLLQEMEEVETQHLLGWRFSIQQGVHRHLLHTHDSSSSSRLCEILLSRMSILNVSTNTVEPTTEKRNSDEIPSCSLLHCPIMFEYIPTSKLDTSDTQDGSQPLNMSLSATTNPSKKRRCVLEDANVKVSLDSNNSNISRHSLGTTAPCKSHFCVLNDFLEPRLPELKHLNGVTDGKSNGNETRVISGRVAASLGLLRVLDGINRYWYTLDNQWDQRPVINVTEFHSAKLNMKANRQLRSYLPVIMNDLPKWLVLLMQECPFLFSFDTRQHFFYLYDADRARSRNYLQTLGVSDTLVTANPNHVAYVYQHQLHPNLNVVELSNSRSHVNASASGGSSSSLIHAPRRIHSLLMHPTTEENSSNETVISTRRRVASFLSSSGTAGTSTSIVSGSVSQLCRRRITIDREEDLLKQAETQATNMCNPQEILEVQFSDEAGFGLGPTQEFYTLLSRDLMRQDLELWHFDTAKTFKATEDGDLRVFVMPLAAGLYPRPIPKRFKFSKMKQKFHFVGILLARAVLDQRQLDLPLSPLIFKWLLGEEQSITGSDLIHVDIQLATQLRYLGQLVYKRRRILESASANATTEIAELGISELYLNFTLPGYDIELLNNGRNMNVTSDNLEIYLTLVTRWFLYYGIARQMIALREGFNRLLPRSRLKVFAAGELENVFCGGDPQPNEDGGSGTRSGVDLQQREWCVATLMESCQADHGYTLDSPAVQHLFHIMQSFSLEERRLFLQFVTGSPRLPVGGFKALRPPLTIVMKRCDSSNLTNNATAQQQQDNVLPSVMTCQNYIKLPNYSTREKMQEKLLLAIREGQHAFHLS